MQNTLTEIAVVLERSGSMEAARTDTIGGLNDVVYLREPILDYTREQVFQRIREPSDVYGRECVYLGAKQDAIAPGAQVGIDTGFALSCADGEVATRELYRSLASNLKMRRDGSKSDLRWEVRDRQVQRYQGAAGDAGRGGEV